MVSLGKTGGGGSNQKSDSFSTQNIWNTQVPFLENLYKSGMDMLNSSSAGLADSLKGVQDFVNPMMNNTFMNMIQGGGNAGMDWLKQTMGPNPHLNDAISAAQEGIFKNFERVARPQENQTAYGYGQLGSDRHGLADSLLQSEAVGQATNIDATMRQQDLQRQQNAAMTYGNMFDTNRMNAMNYVPTMMNNAMMPYQASWMPYMNFANILGGPTTLTNSESHSTGSSHQGGGWNIGFGKMG